MSGQVRVVNKASTGHWHWVNVLWSVDTEEVQAAASDAEVSGCLQCRCRKTKQNTKQNKRKNTKIYVYISKANVENFLKSLREIQLSF